MEKIHSPYGPDRLNDTKKEYKAKCCVYLQWLQDSIEYLNKIVDKKEKQ